VELEFRPSGTDASLLAAYEALFSACFPDAGHLRGDYLRWLYRDNPAGGVVGTDAWEGSRLVAHYACVPAAASLEGSDRTVLLSLNTATHPDYQGRGLFTRLAEATYDAGARDGHALVYGVANANSTPGFLRKLGFSLAGPLAARVGTGRVDAAAGKHAEVPARNASFVRRWPAADLAWRVASPARPWRLGRLRDGTLAAWTPTGTAGICAWSELGAGDATTVPDARRPPWLRLHLGLRPVGARGMRGLWVDVPQRFRSSPLNLIFRPLQADAGIPDAAGIRFNAIDFDAF
jgi:GNAT superfamily N-acetyltransferase